MVDTNSFIGFLKTKKYHIFDFLEPFLVLPILYAILRFFQAVNTTTIVLIVIIFLIYTPLIFTVFKWRRK